ncbi:hypothetical protein E6R18_15755 [Streptomyces sp. A1277]|uniref:VG15 protein n=1 Tax=Streptomyces sp. A1277 TaxID=2563103 RepID=UPI0010A278A5|nr:hypothetical protein [Streptomyces sp. A1277]THA31785.1 hypothetical protein E6R18_15755 [Streptomyces sp. A1277]
MPGVLAQAHALSRIRLALAAARAAQGAWRGIDRDSLANSWAVALGPVVAAVAGAQLAAAQGTEPWLLRLLGRDPDQAESDRLDPLSLAGITGDGTPLVQALQVPMWTTLRLVGEGMPIVHAMARGQALLNLMVRTAVADAGRAADQVAMVARPAVTSYIRVVEAGACSRCIILAGREYGHSTGFLRHPRCHCGMEPVTDEHRPEAQDPQKVYDGMSDKQRRAAFGEAAAKAISEGADIGMVVNARRGMATAAAFGRTVQATTESTTKRGLAHKASRGRGPRLMPEEIFRQADNREHAVRLLRRYGYLF